jgi:hypothetical protein
MALTKWRSLEKLKLIFAHTQEAVMAVGALRMPFCPETWR